MPVALDALTEKAQHQFLHPYPLSDKYLLAAMQTGQQPWGIYLVDVFDNMVPILTDPRFSFFEPIPVASRPAPPVIPDRVDTMRDDAIVVLHDIYKGDGLKGVPRGTIKRLRIAAYHYGYPGMAGPDKVGRAGPWEVDADSRHRSGLRRWFGQISASGKYSCHAAGLGCRGQGGAIDAQLVHGDARRNSLVRRLP